MELPRGIHDGWYVVWFVCVRVRGQPCRQADSSELSLAGSFVRSFVGGGGGSGGNDCLYCVVIDTCMIDYLLPVIWASVGLESL